MSRPTFPHSILEFQARFPDEGACWDYLFECRWPDGFACPKCGGVAYWALRSRRLLECTSCGHQVSITAGTVMHRTRTPLLMWFWAAYLVSTATPGISARQLGRQLGLTRYDTAWTILHKLRRAMVAAERTKLAGAVEVDEFEIGGVEHGRKSGRSSMAKAVHCVIACEVRGTGSGRIRIETITDASGETLCGFVARNVEPGSTIHTDGWQGYAPLRNQGYQWRPKSQRAAKRLGDTEPVMPRAHRAVSNLKAWIHGTHRGFSAEHAQTYLDEYVFRYNRRRTPMAAFQTLLGLSTSHTPTTRAQIIGGGPGADSPHQLRQDLS